MILEAWFSHVGIHGIHHVSDPSEHDRREVQHAVAAHHYGGGGGGSHHTRDVQSQLSRGCAAHLAADWGALVLIIVGLIIYHARKRYVAEQQAGRTLFALRRHSYFLAESGRIARSTFFPWERTNRWYWDACNRSVVVISGDKIDSSAMLVPPEDREAIESLLRQKVQKQHVLLTNSQK